MPRFMELVQMEIGMEGVQTLEQTWRERSLLSQGL